MKKLVVYLLVAGLVVIAPRAAAQSDADQPSGNEAQTPSAVKGNGLSQGKPPVGISEFDLPIDESIQLTVAPVFTSSVVNRLTEPSRITVRCPGAESVQVFFVPVDAPYGGRPTSRPVLIAAQTNAGGKCSAHWADKVSSKYIKIFAVVRKQGSSYTLVRSRGLDFAMGGVRYTGAAGEEQQASP